MREYSIMNRYKTKYFPIWLISYGLLDYQTHHEVLAQPQIYITIK